MSNFYNIDEARKKLWTRDDDKLISIFKKHNICILLSVLSCLQNPKNSYIGRDKLIFREEKINELNDYELPSVKRVLYSYAEEARFVKFKLEQYIELRDDGFIDPQKTIANLLLGEELLICRVRSKTKGFERFTDIAFYVREKDIRLSAEQIDKAVYCLNDEAKKSFQNDKPLPSLEKNNSKETPHNKPESVQTRNDRLLKRGIELHKGGMKSITKIQEKIEEEEKSNSKISNDSLKRFINKKNITYGKILKKLPLSSKVKR